MMLAQTSRLVLRGYRADSEGLGRRRTADVRRHPTARLTYQAATAVAAAVVAWSPALHAAKPIGTAAAVLPLISTLSGQCLGPAGIAPAAGSVVVQSACRSAATQQWEFKAAGSAFELQIGSGNLCLNTGGNSAEGAPTVVARCNGKNAQGQFDFRALGFGYEIVAKASGRCLGIEASSLQDGARVVQQTCNRSASQIWATAAGDTAASSWTPLKTLTLVPAAAAHLPDGKMLFWSSHNRFDFNSSVGRTYTSVFDPVTMTATETLVTNTGHDMFCPGIANLPDGRIHVTGGNTSQQTSLYDPRTGSWSAGVSMNIARGYQGSVTLSNGSVLTYGGSWSGGIGGKDGEVWTDGGWRRVASLIAGPLLTEDVQGAYRSDNHGWFFATANGRVFHAGPSKTMHWIDTVGAGSITSAGLRGTSATDAMNGTAVMYDVGRILTVGGAPSYQDSPATSAANVIDIRSATASVRTIAPMAFARALHSSVVLPNGQVVVIGGQGIARPFSEDQAVLRPELWDPRTETFTQLKAMAVARVYHSVALLLPDGRVLAGGGGLCGDGCAGNHPDVQILTPPYLLDPDGTTAVQPQITAAPTQAALGTTLSVSTDSAVGAFALVRLSSITHSVNNEQRRVPLSFSASASGNSYQVAVPADSGVVVPGYWMLFALSPNGVPSKAKIVRIS